MEQLDYNHIHLAIMAIEKGAQQLHISPKDMYRRLKKQGLVHNFLLPYYEELHTQSLEWVADTTVETLKNWEAHERLRTLAQAKPHCNDACSGKGYLA